MIPIGIASSQQRAETPDPGVCTIGVSGDQAPLVGLVPAQVDGRRVYIDSAPATELTTYAAFSDLANPQPILSGEQVSELSFEQLESDDASIGLVIADETISTIVVGSWGLANDFFIYAQDANLDPIPGSVVSIPDIQGTVTLALSVNGTTGAVEAYIDGQPQGLVSLNSFYDDVFAGVTALHTGVTIEARPTAEVPVGATLSVAAETMVSQYPAGLIDRCGNALP